VLRLRPGHPPVRVLIADDKLENRELLRELLESAAFETRTANDGEEAIKAFADWHPRVVLMDLRMPGIPGLEAMRRIRQLPGGPNVALIAVSASVFEDDRRDVFAAGGDDFLGKPFRQEALFDKIQRFTGVEYLYEDEAELVHAEAARVDLTPKEVAAALPAEARERLRAAAVNADFDGMLEVLAEREAQAPAVVAELRGRIERFEYQSVLALLEDESVPG
jgi:CheY-like chemotaxis protein